MSIFASMSLCSRFCRRFSSAIFYPYPVPRDLISGSAPRSDLMSNADRRPLHLCLTVQLLINLRDLDTAAEYARLAYSQFYCDSTVKTCDSIIGAMCEAKRYRDALDLYHYFFNVLKMRATYNSPSHIIKALCDLGRVEDALVLFRAVPPNRISYGHLTKGFVDAGRFDEALCLHREYPESLACKNLIRGFLNIGNLDMANQLLEEFESKGFWAHRPCECKNEAANVRVAFIEHWLKQGKDEEALRWYQSLMGNNRFQVFGDTGNELLQLLLVYGKKTEAWELFDGMLDSYRWTQITVNSKTIDIMVKECFNEGRFEEGINTFYKVKAKVEYLKAVDYRNVITRCCDQGMLSEAECLLAEFSSGRSFSVDVPTYRTMMDAYVKAGRVDDALRLANNMVVGNLTHLSLWLQC